MIKYGLLRGYSLQQEWAILTNRVNNPPSITPPLNPTAQVPSQKRVPHSPSLYIPHAIPFLSNDHLSVLTSPIPSFPLTLSFKHSPPLLIKIKLD